MRKSDDPTALVCALKNGIDPPEDYVPKAQRDAEAERRRKVAMQKTDEELRNEEAEVKARREAEQQLSELSAEKREELFAACENEAPSSMQRFSLELLQNELKLFRQ